MNKTVTTKVMEKIIDRLAQGETLVDITKDKNMPSYRSVTRAVAANDELFEMYRRGRILQAEYMSDRIAKLCMEPLPSGLDVRELNAEVNRRRLVLVSILSGRATRVRGRLFSHNIDYVKSCRVSSTFARLQRIFAEYRPPTLPRSGRCSCLHIIPAEQGV